METCLWKDMNDSVTSSLICNSWKLDPAQMSINRRITAGWMVASSCKGECNATVKGVISGYTRQHAWIFKILNKRTVTSKNTHPLFLFMCHPRPCKTNVWKKKLGNVYLGGREEGGVTRSTGELLVGGRGLEKFCSLFCVMVCVRLWKLVKQNTKYGCFLLHIL